jgi:hypothetical protein
MDLVGVACPLGTSRGRSRVIDLTGKIFGFLTVQRYLGKRIRRGDLWECRCSCGNTVKALGGALRRGETHSCGKGLCRHGTNLVGQAFGKLTVLSYLGADPAGNRLWLCQCACGKTKELGSHYLVSGKTKSCGAPECRFGIPKGEASFRALLLNYRNNARDRDLVWELTSDQFRELTRQPCYYCGVPPSQICGSKAANGTYTYNGVDRLDPKKGYFEGNTVPCCKLCNLGKRNLSQTEFKDWARRLVAWALSGMPEVQIVRILAELGYEVTPYPKK